MKSLEVGTILIGKYSGKLYTVVDVNFRMKTCDLFFLGRVMQTSIGHIETRFNVVCKG
jgi:hypothetical protein